ncbi:hypothetical protein J27TS8_32820 [Robertmurraya siralis]|jgi:hypothetical protein|uniref:YvrJ family protein n=1 Tax=Robertmurraya siralis TaxID=77777 RepID=A0A920BUQ9_9BACI|nr:MULTISPECIES: YvrJ family protein [Robertmurraya]MDF1510278.1 YvrJ family protein [Robertmurraya sp. DFI.2.37]GIN63289.1 hypothetical protein J27TS8_32820 [Robertmurraya siralis]
MNTEIITIVEALVTVVGNTGFPLVLASYLLLRFEKKIESLTEAINHLYETMKK